VHNLSPDVLSREAINKHLKKSKNTKKCNLHLISSYEETGLILKNKGGCTVTVSQIALSQMFKCNLMHCDNWLGIDFGILYCNLFLIEE
jgi:hypothetical protein